MSLNARQKAERCFALARSTTFDAERDNAVRMGTLIAEKAGLSLDLFDIPGRTRKPVPDALFEGNGIFGPDGFVYSDNLREVRDDEDLFEEVMRRYFSTLDRMSKVEAERERRSERRVWRLRDALNFLWSRGVRIHPLDAPDRYFSEDHHDPAAELTGDDVILAAQSRGWKG